MNRTFRNLLSFLCLGFFLLAAINSLPIGIDETECGDESNVILEPIPSSSQFSTIRIRTVDYASNEPLSGMKVHMFLVVRFVSSSSKCPGEGIMGSYYLEDVNMITNSAGIITTQAAWAANDKKDRLFSIVNAEDPSNNYVPLQTNIWVDQDDPTSTYTLRMIHKDLL
jgi:hypothetical protein